MSPVTHEVAEVVVDAGVAVTFDAEPDSSSTVLATVEEDDENPRAIIDIVWTEPCGSAVSQASRDFWCSSFIHDCSPRDPPDGLHVVIGGVCAHDPAATSGFSCRMDGRPAWAPVVDDATKPTGSALLDGGSDASASWATLFRPPTWRPPPEAPDAGDGRDLVSLWCVP